MKNAWIALLGLALSVPAWAQEEPTPAPETPAAPEAAPADQAPPAEAAPAETPPAAEAVPAETPPAAQAEAAPAEAEAPKEPWPVYAGISYAKTKVSSSGAGSLGTADYHGKFLSARVGKRLFDGLGLEFQYGMDLSDFASNEISTDRYYGLFLVPTATVFESVELAFPVGYGRGQYSLGQKTAVSKSVAYGFKVEVPLKAFGDSYPDLRLTGGWMIYNQTSAARVYGPEFGVRYDFNVPNPGNPFTGFGGWYKSHMPGWLGGGESTEAPPAS
jgi:hypothetical protein